MVHWMVVSSVLASHSRRSASAALHQLEWESLDHPHPHLFVTAIGTVQLSAAPYCYSIPSYCPIWRQTCSDTQSCFFKALWILFDEAPIIQVQKLLQRMTWDQESTSNAEDVTPLQVFLPLSPLRRTKQHFYRKVLKASPHKRLKLPLAPVYLLDFAALWWPRVEQK